MLTLIQPTKESLRPPKSNEKLSDLDTLSLMKRNDLTTYHQ